MQAKLVGKREFIQHTSKYLKLVEGDGELVVTHQNKPVILIVKIKTKSFKDLRGFAAIKVHGDINSHVFPGYDEW